MCVCVYVNIIRLWSDTTVDHMGLSLFFHRRHGQCPFSQTCCHHFALLCIKLCFHRRNNNGIKCMKYLDGKVLHTMPGYNHAVCFQSRLLRLLCYCAVKWYTKGDALCGGPVYTGGGAVQTHFTRRATTDIGLCGVNEELLRCIATKQGVLLLLLIRSGWWGNHRRF